MTGTVSQSHAFSPSVTNGRLQRTAISWLSTAGGLAGDTIAINGTILGVEFVPDSGGTQPTDQYDVTLNDAAGVDVLSGLGANLSNASATYRVPLVTGSDGTNSAYLPRVVAESLTLAVTNAGNAKGGQLIIYHR